MSGCRVDIRLPDQPVEYGEMRPFPFASGGECVFLGRTREETHPIHGRLLRLSYEAYWPMAERVLRELAERAAAEHGCQAIHVAHAIGEVPVGAASVVVQVAAGHRDAAFDACRFLIDRLKAEAPIWKRECWEDGATWSAGVPVPEPSRQRP